MKIIRAEYDGENGVYVVRGRESSKQILCHRFVAEWFNRKWPPWRIVVRASASRFKGAKKVWIKIEHGDGIRWRRGIHSLWNPMFPAAQRRVRKLYPSGRLLYTVRKLYYRIELV